MIRRFISRYRRFIQKKDYWKRGIVIAHNVDYGNVELGDYVNVAHHAQVSNSTIGTRTSIGRYSKIQMSDIGKFCSISWDVTIGALEHPIHAITTHAFPYRKQFGISEKDFEIPHKRVTIGNDVWIGCGAIIMPGITIGDGAVIGAGGVVTHNVDAYEIVAGCPAKHIAWRFPSETIQKLESLKWWNFSDSELKKYAQYFKPDIDLNQNIKCLDELISICKKG